MSQPVICPVVVGRDEEISRLEDALLRAARGEDRFVVVVGEAGIGKSRVTAELEMRARRLGFTVMHGGCTEAELTLPYLPVIEAIGNHINTQDLDPLLERLGAARTELARLFPHLALEEPSLPESDAAQAKLRLFESIVTLLSVAASDRGLLFVIEDIHWADTSTRELLDYLTRRLRGLRAMVLVTYRSDELHRKHPLAPTVHGWRRSGLADIVELKVMSEEEVGHMMSSIFGEIGITPDLRDHMHRRSEGNPFVLEEMLRDAVDRGDIYRTPSRWERRELEQFSLPSSVKETILLRLERLDARDVDILRTAAVLGFTFSYILLIEVANATPSEVQNALASAISNQLIAEEPTGEERYRFRHALTQEAIYDDLLSIHRQEIHSRAADALAADPTTNPIDLALHLLGGGRFSEAVPACLAAAANAEASHAYGEAIALYERALPHVSDEIDRARVLCRMGRALNVDGHAARAAACLEEGIPRLERTGAPLEAAGFRLDLGRAQWELARPDLSSEQYEKALDVLRQDGGSADLALAYMRVAGLRLFELDAELGLEAARRALETAEAAGDEAIRIWALGFLGLALLDTGDVGGGLGALEKSYEEASIAGLVRIAQNSAFNDLWVRVHAMLPGAKGALQRLLASSDWGEWARASGLLCEMYMMRLGGEIDRWVESGRQCVERLTAIQHDKGVWRAKVLLAEALFETDEIQQAEQQLPDFSTRVELQDIVYDSPARIRILMAGGKNEHLREAALSILDQAPKLWIYPPTLALGVEALVHLGDLQDAARLIDIALSRPYPAARAPIEQARGRLALARGDAHTAVEHLTTAAQGYGDAGYVLDELRTQTLLAAARAAAGDREGAEGILVPTVERAIALTARRVAQEAVAVARGARIDLDLPQATMGHGDTATGERLVTVLFADIRGYTQLSSNSSPEHVTDLVASLQRWATVEVERHFGVVDKFAGDAVMATFNVAGDQVDHPRRALEAAIALRDKAEAGGIPLATGIAVGSAVVGRLAPDANLSVIGETTNLAARLQQAASPGEIVLSDEAYRRVRGWLDDHDLRADERELTLKGFATPVRAHGVSRRGRA